MKINSRSNEKNKISAATTCIYAFAAFGPFLILLLILKI